VAEMDRRTVLRGGLVGVGSVATSALWGCTPAPADPVPTGPFDCGVASGVHSDSAVVLWTRFAPASAGAVDLDWQVATDPAFSEVVASGTALSSAATDGCVKVLAGGLAPGTRYWYRFAVDGTVSPVGRTRTPPAPGQFAPAATFAVASCQDYRSGFYPAWRAIAAEDLDAVIHLGDYIYESGGSSPFDLRADTVGAATDLAGYRAKYRLYRGDPDLQAAHAAHPFAAVWDDHEFVNDYHRLTLLERPERAQAAYRAWWEYQPVWPIAGDRIHRRARWGDLVDLSLIDTRQYRDPQPMEPGGGSPRFGATTEQPIRVVHDADRTILGAGQRQWLLDGFSAAQDDGVTWKLVGNQVMFSPLRLVDLDEPAVRALAPDLPRHAGVYINFDDWDGYQWERDVITNHLHDQGVSNVGFLTGDIHSFWQSRVRRDFDEDYSPVVAQEFVCGSISSRGVDFAGDLAPELAQAVKGTRPGFRFVDLVHRGYGHVTCTPEHAAVEFRRVDATTRNANGRRLARFDWNAGERDVVVTRG
jgi:alkaline phosphatase D